MYVNQSALSPLLFAIAMDCIIGPLQRDASWDMLFADDVVLCGETCDEVERRLENWREAMEDRGMRVSREKTEDLCLGSQEDQVHMEGCQIKRVGLPLEPDDSSHSVPTCLELNI